MLRIRRWAAVAAFLALSAAAASACQLSLVGTVTQQPLTYNPFQAGPSTATISFTLRNADTAKTASAACNVAFAFFRSGAPRARFIGGELNYQVLNASGVSGAAASLTQKLQAAGYDTLTPSDTAAAQGTVVYCASGLDREASALAAAVGTSPPARTAPMPNPLPENGDANAACIVVAGS